MTDHVRTVSGKSIFVLIVAVACVVLITAPGVDASWPRCNNGGFSCPPNVTCNVTTGFCECFAANIMSVHRNCQVLLLPGQPRTVHYDQGYSGEYIDVDGHHWMKYPSGSMPYLQIYFEMELSVKVKNSDPDEKVKPLVVAGLSMETVTKAISIGLRRTIDPNTSALVVKWDEDAIAQSDLDVFAGDSSGTWNPKNIGGYNGRNADLDIYFVELLSGSFNYSALTVGVTTFEAAVRPSVNTWFLLIFSAIVILIFLAVFALFFEELGGRKVLPKWMYLQTFPRFMKAFRRRTSIWYVMDERTAHLSTEKDDSSLWERIIAGMTIMVERIKSQLKDKGRSNTKSDQQDENVEKVEEQPGGLVDKEIVPGDIPSSVLRIGPLSELSPSHVMDFSFYEILFRRTGISTMTIEEIEEFLETSPQQQLPAVRPIDAAHLQANGKKSKRGSVECFECNLSADRRYVMLFFDSVPRAQLARRILMSREASLVPVITADHYDRLNDLIRLHLQNLSNRTKESKVAAANANAVHPVDTAGKPVEESASVKTDKEAESKEDWTVPVEMGKEDLFFRRSSTFDGVMATCTCGFWLLRESIRDVSESEFASLLQDDEFIDAVYPFFQAVTCMYAKENYGNWRFCNTKYLEIADVLPKREFLGRLIPQEVTTKLHVANFRGRIGVTPVGIEKWFSLSSWVKYMPELTVSIPSLQTMGLIDYMIPVYKPPAMVVALSIKGIGLGLLSGFTSALGNFSASLGLPAGFGTPSVSADIPSAPSVPKASLGFGSITASFAKLTAPSVSLGVPGVPVPEVSVPSVDVPDVPKMPELPAGISLETGVPGLSRLFNVPLNPVVRLRIPSLTLPSASILSFGGMCRLTMFQLRRFRFLGIIHFFTNLIMQAIVTVLMAFRIIINIFVMAASFATFLNLVGYKSLIRLQDIRASLSMFDFVIEYGYWFVEWSPIGFAVDIDVASLIPVAGSTPCGGTQAAILFIISGFLLFITYVIMKRELIFFFLIKFSIVAQSVDRKNALLKRARGKVNNFDSSTSAWGLILDTFGRGAAAVVLLLLSMAFVFIAQLYFTIFTIQRTCNGVDSILRISTIVLLSFLSVVIFDALFAVYGGKSSIDLLEQAPHRYLMQKFDGKNETVGVGYWLRRATKLVSGRPIASITADSQDPDCIVLGETASAVNDILNRSSGKLKSDAKYSSDHLELPVSPHAAKFQKKGWLSRGAKTTLAGPALERFLRTFEKQAPKSLDPEIELPDCLEKYPTVIDGSAGASSFAGCTTRDIVLALVALKPARTGSQGVVNSSTGIFGHLESSLKQTVSGVRDATFGDGVAIATSEACRAAWLRAVQSAAVKMKYWTILKEDMGVANLAFVLWATGKLPFPTTDRSTPSSVASALEALNNDVDTKWYACFVTFYLASVERSNPEPWNPVSRMFFALMICFLLPLLRIADGAWYLLKISFGLWAARTCERFALLERADVFGSSALDGSEEREAETRSAVLANIGRTNTLVFCMLPGLSFLNKLAEFLNMYPVWVPPSFNVVLTDNRVPNLMRWLSAVTIMFGSAAIIFQPIPLIGYIILFAFFFLRFVELVVSLMGSSDDKKRPKDAEAGLSMFSIGRAVVNHASKIIYDGNQKVRQLAGQADLARRMNDARQLFADRADSVVTSMSTEKSFMRKND